MASLRGSEPLIGFCREPQITEAEYRERERLRDSKISNQPSIQTAIFLSLVIVCASCCFPLAHVQDSLVESRFRADWISAGACSGGKNVAGLNRLWLKGC